MMQKAPPPRVHVRRSKTSLRKLSMDRKCFPLHFITIQNFILLPNINTVELGIKVEKSISRTSLSLPLKQHFSFKFPQLQSLK